MEHNWALSRRPLSKARIIVSNNQSQLKKMKIIKAKETLMLK